MNPAAIVTLTCEIPYSDVRRKNMKEKERTPGGWGAGGGGGPGGGGGEVRNVMATFLLPAKVICTSD